MLQEGLEAGAAPPPPLPLQAHPPRAALPLAPAEPLPTALHVRAWKYLPAASADIRAFFAPLVPSYITWLNAVSLNVVFGDAATAARALASAGEPVAAVPSVPPVHPAWRTCLKPLIKVRQDKWAPAGAETTIWVRYATTHDTKENAAPTHGACWHARGSCCPASDLSFLAALTLFLHTGAPPF